MCSRNDVAHLYESANDAADALALERARQQEEPTMSPWVKRNRDWAQYPQARGSQYEGPTYSVTVNFHDGGNVEVHPNLSRYEAECMVTDWTNTHIFDPEPTVTMTREAPREVGE